MAEAGAGLGGEGLGAQPSTRAADQVARVGGRGLAAAGDDLAAFEEGTWGLAILSRHEVVGSDTIELGRLGNDYAPRAALVVQLDVSGHGDRPFTVVGTHAAHLTAGSPLQFHRLRAALAGRVGPAASPVT